MVNGQRVVVFDGLNETEQVLKAILEPQGCRVNRIRNQHTGDITTADEVPSIVVVHDNDTSHKATCKPGWSKVPKIVIGSVKERQSSNSDQSTHFLVQPFHYAELIDSIESLLQQPQLNH